MANGKHSLANDFTTMAEQARFYADLMRRPGYRQANYGDGEWMALLGERVGQGNSDGGTFTERLRDQLRETLEDPRFTIYGWNPGPCLDGALSYLAAHWMRTGRVLPWVSKEVLANINKAGELAPVVQAIRERPTMLVGGPHVQQIERQGFFKPRARVVVDGKDATLEVDDIVQRIERICNTGAKPALILFSCGMATNVIMWRLCRMIDRQITMVDCGAIWDPYVGRLSRTYYNRPAWLPAEAKNRRDIAALGDLAREGGGHA
jgi:hypothetical protein